MFRITVHMLNKFHCSITPHDVLRVMLICWIQIMEQYSCSWSGQLDAGLLFLWTEIANCRVEGLSFFAWTLLSLSWEEYLLICNHFLRKKPSFNHGCQQAWMAHQELIYWVCQAFGTAGLILILYHSLFRILLQSFRHLPKIIFVPRWPNMDPWKETPEWTLFWGLLFRHVPSQRLTGRQVAMPLVHPCDHTKFRVIP